MMFSNSSHQVALQGFDVEGAANYMVQPTPNQDLQLVVSQHVGRRSENDFPVPISGGINSVRGRNPKPSKKKRGGRKEGSKGCDPHQFTANGGKKQRLIWTPDLHQNFLVAHNSSLEKPVPKKILEQMRINFPYITRENVASHLQKHRLYLKKLQNKELGNSSKSSPTSVPLKSTKQSNFKPTHNSYSYSNSNSNSNFTCPNPNVHQLPLQSQIFQNETLLNQPMLMNILQPSFDIDWNDSFYGESLMWPNMINEAPIGQSSNSNPAPNSAPDNFSFRIDLFHPPTSTTQFSSNIDCDPNAFLPIPGDHSNNDYNDFFSIPNIGDFTMNFENLHVDGDQKNNMFCVGSYSDGFDYGCPVSFNVTNEMQKEFEQIFQTIFVSSGSNHLVNHLPNDASTLPQTFATSWEQQGQHLKREGEGSNLTFTGYSTSGLYL